MMRNGCFLAFLVLFLSPLAGVGLWKKLPFLSRVARAAEGSAARRGVSLCGAEFGADKADFSNENPGTYGQDYSYPGERTVAYFCDQGLGLLRLPFRWERIQPRLGEALDAAELKRLKTTVEWVRKHHGEVILDVHNYGRYCIRRHGKKQECIIDQKMGSAVVVSRQHFADLWRRLSQAFREEPTVCAYGLMNEPHDLGTSDWHAISQAAVDAVRGEKDHKLILVAGDGWSNAHRFPEVNGTRAWIKDATGQVAYEAHCYFDHDNSGKYELDFDEELTRDSKLEERGEARLRPFVGWCQKNRVRGFLGEYGIPAGDKRWQKVLARFLHALNDAGMDSCYWAAGERWGNYPLSIQPRRGFLKAAPQLHVLKQ
jgi:endoglucanase